GDEVLRVLFDGGRGLGEDAIIRLRADDDAVSAGRVGRLHDEFADVGKQVLAGLVLGRTECGDVGEDGLFAEIETDHLGDVRVNGLVVGNAGANRVDEADGAGAVG